MSGLAHRGGVLASAHSRRDGLEEAAYLDRVAGGRDPREPLEGLAVGRHHMGRPVPMPGSSGFGGGAKVAHGSSMSDLSQMEVGGEHDPPLESQVRELMVENWRMRAIIHNLAFERDHWNKVSADAEAEAAKYRLTAHSLQAQVRQYSMGARGAMGGMSRELHLPHHHTHAEGGEKGRGQAHVGAAGMGAGGVSGRLMGAPYERMGEGSLLRSGDGDEETLSEDTHLHVASAHERDNSSQQPSGERRLSEAGGARGGMEGANDLAASPFWQAGASRHGQAGGGNGLH